MPRMRARRWLCAVGLSLVIASPVIVGGPASATVGSFSELRLGDSGPRVLFAQRALQVRPRDRLFNGRTHRAVKRFQSRRGLAATGVIDHVTWHALQRRWTRLQAARQRIKGQYARVLQVARNQLGDPYVFGAAGPGAFDCSGLILYSYRKATGRVLAHSAAVQARSGVVVTRRQARPGDLVVFRENGRVFHAGIYAGRGRLIHASRPGTNVKRDPIWTWQGVSFVRLIPQA